jgi:predicted DCC family thiol-disulfide oxidoreductase YuxK
MSAGLGFPWSLARILRALPPSWRDRLYGFLARNRLRIFGRNEVCYLADRDHGDRFLA